MAIRYIDTSAKEVKTQSEKKDRKRLKLFLKSLGLTFLVAAVLLVVIFFILAALIYPQAKNLSAQVEKTYQQAKKIETDLKAKDLTTAQADLEGLKVDTSGTRGELNKLSYLRFIPLLSGYYNDAQHLLNSTDIGLDFSSKTLSTIKPYADVLGFKGTNSNLNAEQKAQEIITKLIPKLIPLTDEASSDLNHIKEEFNQINPDRYPDGLEIKGVKIKDSLITAKGFIAKASDLLPQIKPLLVAAPEIAGSPNEKTYLILLQNDKELRATGGFITSYGLAKVKDGRLVGITTDDIYHLDQRYNRTLVSPYEIRNYIGWTFLPIRDSNFNPDYKISAMKFESMYNTIKGMPKVDGVIALDTEFVRTFLAATGPITVPKTKQTFSAANNKLGIPDVVYKLELEAEIINQNQPGRKGILGDLMNSLLSKVLNAKPEEIPKYISVFIDTVRRKHILFYFHNKTFQKFAEKYNAAGRVVGYNNGDYFMLNNSNFGGLKGNLYIKQAVEQDITVDAFGNVKKTITVTLINPAKADGWLNSIYLNWMRIYVPEGSQLISKEVQKDFTSGVDLGKEVFRGYGATYPLHSSTSTFTYELPFRVDPNGVYKMLIQKQPGVDNIHMTIKINGLTRDDFYLNTDKEVSYQL